MTQPRLILASASPRRKVLLEQMGFPADEILPADVDESERRGELPRDYVLRVAKDKANKIHHAHPDAIVIAADTTVACGRRIMQKAENEAEARSFLQMLSGRRHTVYTGVVMGYEGRLYSKVVETVVKFRTLLPNEIDAYVAGGEWEGKAGGYGIQGSAEMFIPWIRGSYSNIVGLPLHETRQLLRRALG